MASNPRIAYEHAELDQAVGHLASPHDYLVLSNLSDQYVQGEPFLLQDMTDESCFAFQGDDDMSAGFGWVHPLKGPRHRHLLPLS
jgi:hypothetical protein